MGKKTDEMRKVAIVDLDIPMRDAAKGALGEIEIKEKGEHPPAKVQPVEPAEAKPAEKTMLPEAPEHPERSEGAGWYDAFGLWDNPFKYTEASIEDDIESLPILETPMLNRVKALVEGEISCIVVGVRGCGKSLLLRSLKGIEGMEVREPEKSLTAVTPRDVDDLYSKIFGEACNVEFRGFRKKVTGDDKVGAAARSLGGSFMMRLGQRDPRTGEHVCAVCKIHCSGIPFDVEPGGLVNFFRNAPPGCKAQRMIINTMLRDGDFINMAFLLDSPDNIAGREYIRFISLCGAILSGGANLILFCTPGQADALQGSDTLARLSRVKWDSPSKEFFMKLFRGRVEMFRTEGSTAPHPFTDEVVEKMASLANYNVRDFIRICSMVLTEMWLRKMTSPCTLEFLNELKIRPAAPSDRATIVGILKQHGGQWVGIQDLAREISEALGAPITERKAGAMVRDFGFDQFKRDAKGRSQVLISPNVLSAIEPPEDTEHSEGSEG